MDQCSKEMLVYTIVIPIIILVTWKMISAIIFRSTVQHKERCSHNRHKKLLTYPKVSLAQRYQYILRKPNPPGTHYGIAYDPKNLQVKSLRSPQFRPSHQLWWKEKFQSPVKE